jgi:lysine 2,3-aminomutase
VVLRNYEGVITTYKEPDSYEPKMCDRDCEACRLELNVNEADETAAIGIEKLLADADDTISLYPENNERMQRREEHGGQD